MRKPPTYKEVKTPARHMVLWSATGRAFAAFMPWEKLEAFINLELQDTTPEQRRLLRDRKAVKALFAEIQGFRLRSGSRSVVAWRQRHRRASIRC
jgi:DNA-binding IclR family transcriptional regulator